MLTNTNRHFPRALNIIDRSRRGVVSSDDISSIDALGFNWQRSESLFDLEPLVEIPFLFYCGSVKEGEIYNYLQ